MVMDAATADRWVRRLGPAGDGARLACFPHAGGSATFFAPLARLLPGVELLGVQYPGRQDRRAEPAVADLTALADEAVRALTGWIDRPLALFGHSMGALVAYEVARRLERDHAVMPLALFVSGRAEPARPVRTSLSAAPDDALVAHMRRLGGTDPRLLADPELRSLILPAVRADYAAVERYRYVPGQPIAAPVTVFTGDRDPMVPAGAENAWRSYTTGQFDAHVFGGDHFYLVEHQDRITALMADRLSALRV